MKREGLTPKEIELGKEALSPTRFDWDLSRSDFEVNRILAELRRIADNEYADIADLFPFRGTGWEFSIHKEKDWVAAVFIDWPGAQMPYGGAKGFDQVDAVQRLTASGGVPPYPVWRNALDQGSFAFDKFTYIGPLKNDHGAWLNAVLFLRQWIADCVLPRVLKLNQSRIERAVSIPPTYDVGKILDSLVVLEGDEKQGTGFLLDGIGLVTCAHVIEESTEAYLANNRQHRVPIVVKRQNPVIDFAVFECDLKLKSALRMGDSDALRQLDHLLVAGFPNHNFGDSGVAMPGFVTGFRMRNGIRLILSNAPIVFGNSGGPAISKADEVIGIALSGTKSVNESNKTEENGILPIELLKPSGD